MSLRYDLVCLSHLRWDFVYQRPQHLLSRFARDHRVFFVEEPVFDNSEPTLSIIRRSDNLFIAVPHLPIGMTGTAVISAQRHLLDQLCMDWDVSEFVLWYYTPMAVSFAGHLRPLATIYDCMDELSMFHGAPRELQWNESRLFDQADLVFTGGNSLYEAKQQRHPDVHLFPSSVDLNHFSQARAKLHDPDDQAEIGHPRIGFFGVIDERMDLDLLEAIATLRPQWQLVLVGPVAKIDPRSLPRCHNIQYLGQKDYSQLPQYLAGWDVTMLPFARNQATRFISPTKTLEYLAASKPVVSTPIPDVVHPYGEEGLVRIAHDADEFVTAIEALLIDDGVRRQQLTDVVLSQTSWDSTWAAMSRLVEKAIARNQSTDRENEPVREITRNTIVRRFSD